jgi:hypothetical protein
VKRESSFTGGTHEAPFFVLAAFGFLLTPASAQQQTYTARGLICDTAEQVERYVTAKDQAATFTAINAENPDSCEIDRVTFFMGESVKHITSLDGKVWDIKPILIIEGVVNGRMQELVPFSQFAAFLTDEEGA